MKRIHRLVLSLALVVVTAAVTGACASKAKPATSPPAPPPAAQPSPASVAAPAAAAMPPTASGASHAAAPPPLTGFATRATIESFNDQWKALRAEDYTPDAAEVATIRRDAKDVDVFAVVGTWCPDTRRDLPRFWKIADQAGWSTKKMKFLAVDRTKKDAGGETVKWNVTRVPTFIFMRKGKEIGRVVEKPKTTLEQDIAAIIAKPRT